MFPGAAHARHPERDRRARGGRHRRCCSASCVPSDSRARRDSARSSTSSRVLRDADVAVPAERVGAARDHVVAECDDRTCCRTICSGRRRPRRSCSARCCIAGSTRSGFSKAQESAQRWARSGAMRDGSATALLHAVRRRAARARAEGAPALLPRHDAVVAADPARRARDGLRLQHQVPAAARRGHDVLPRQRRAVPESRARRLRARVDRGAVHLSRRQPRGPHALAAALEPDVDARAAVGEVLGRHAAAADSRAWRSSA